MSERFFVPELALESTGCVLEGDEARHLATVCRARPGDVVQLFNGQGVRATAQVVRLGKREVELAVRHTTRTHADPTSLAMASAFPKGDRLTFLVEKLTELGAGRLIPLVTKRSVVDPSTSKLDRLRRTVIEACKQCGRDWLMPVAEPVAWPDYVDSLGPDAWFLDVEGDTLEVIDKRKCPAVVVIGPEGGWTEDERMLARQRGLQLVRLPGHVLRIETAAIAMASWFRLAASGL